MKIKDLKHNHSLTDLLKVLIFSILMLAPMIAVAVKCAYVVVNKNANQSYGGNQILTETTVTNYNMLLNNYDYVLNIKTFIDDTNTIGSGTTDYLYPKEPIHFNVYDINITDDIINNTAYFRLLRANANYTNFELFNSSGTRIYNLAKNNNTWLENYTNNFLIPFTLINSQQINEAYYDNFLVQLQYVVPKLDNVFYYAIEEMSDNQLFSWTKNTGIYTGIKAMTDNLEITTDVIAVLITYWTLLTVIYVIIDIVLKGFTLLTHMFQKESH